jgi:hypothetical protein
MSETLLRRLGRDQWVRVHGTPRITVLAGGEDARRLWEHWLGVANIEGEILGGDAGTSMRDAMAKALEAPARPIAVHAASDALASWRRGRTDRLAAMFTRLHPQARQPADRSFVPPESRRAEVRPLDDADRANLRYRGQRARETIALAC